MRANWVRFNASMKRLTTVYPDQWNVNHYAWYACFVGDLDPVREQLPNMEVVIQPVWLALKNYEDCRDFLIKQEVGVEILQLAKQRLSAAG